MDARTGCLRSGIRNTSTAPSSGLARIPIDMTRPLSYTRKTSCIEEPALPKTPRTKLRVKGYCSRPWNRPVSGNMRIPITLFRLLAEK